jgi:hypothetical protein
VTAIAVTVPHESEKRYSLSSLIFYGPTDAQRVIQEYISKSGRGYPNPEITLCVQRMIIDAEDFLSKSKNLSSEIINNYLKITNGKGKIIESSHPRLIPIDISIEGVTGGYNPRSRQMMLEINDRMVELYLLQPLTENQPVKFIVKKITRDNEEGKSISEIISNKYIASIESDFVTEGTLWKIGNQINGNFKTEGVITLNQFFGRYEGAITGEFSLNVEPHQSLEVPLHYGGRILTEVVEKCLEATPVSH